MAAENMSTGLHRALLVGVLFGSFVGFRLLWNSYDNYCKERAYYEQVRNAKPFLEASNPVRRRVGLWPIATVFSERTYTEGYHDPNVNAVKLSGSRYGYQPHPIIKVIGYDSKRRQLLWEREIIYFSVIHLGDSSNYVLHRTFSYSSAQATAQGHNIWGIDSWTNNLTCSTNANSEHSNLLNKAQADSVLRDWRARGVRDSLAALTENRH